MVAVTMRAFIEATVLALIGISSAIPLTTNLNRRSVGLNAQSCKAKSIGPFVHYKITVGTPYDPKLCEATSEKLYSNVAQQLFSSYTCNKVEDGFTEVKFNYLFNKSAKINEAMEHAFPEVNGFNCPDY
ncbi:hypothetical protein PRZ48_001137 [Zasmidium cellare]|uniref:Uncharacterized protein n=1 Tax=Zasmidium cellare TaxID=395010 RepID=A0ABR0F0G0_ZASCE|nr:hypothetical protein PRZ48_001137 [Zasmidium cellare]